MPVAVSTCYLRRSVSRTVTSNKPLRPHIPAFNVSVIWPSVFMEFSLIWTILAGTIVVHISGIGCILLISKLPDGGSRFSDF